MSTLSLCETGAELELLKVMLAGNDLWETLDSAQRLRFYVKEFLRRKTPLFKGIARKLFTYLENLSKSLARKNKDRNKWSWEHVRTEMIRIVCDYAPSQSELHGYAFPKHRNFASYFPWGKSLHELYTLQIFEWAQIVRELNHSGELIEFRGRFKAESPDFRFLLDLCKEVDQLRAKNSKESKIELNKDRCYYCKEAGHTKMDCQKLKNLVSRPNLTKKDGPINDSIYIVKNNKSFREKNPYIPDQYKGISLNTIKIEGIWDMGQMIIS